MSSNIPKVSIVTGDSTTSATSTDSVSGAHSLRKRHSPGSASSSSKIEETARGSDIAAFSKLRKISASGSKAGIFAQQGTSDEGAEAPESSKASTSTGHGGGSASGSGSGRRSSQLKYLTDYFPNQQSNGEFRLTRSRSKATSKQNDPHETSGSSSATHNQRSHIPISQEKGIKRHSSQNVAGATTSGFSHLHHAESGRRGVGSDSASSSMVSTGGATSSQFPGFNTNLAQHAPFPPPPPPPPANLDFVGTGPNIPMHFDLGTMNPSVIMNLPASPSSAMSHQTPQLQSANEISTIASQLAVSGVGLGTSAVGDFPVGIDSAAGPPPIDYFDGSGRNVPGNAAPSSSSSSARTAPASIGINRSGLTVGNYTMNSNTNMSTSNSKPSSSVFGLRSHQHVNRATTFLGSLVPRMQHLLGNSSGGSSSPGLGNFGSGGSGNVHFHHSSNRIMSIVDGLRSTNEIRQSEAASELAEMLLLGNEESLPNMPVRDIIQCLMVLLQKDHNFELMLTAARCITNMQEALPRALPVITEAIPLLLQKLKRIEYIDVAEQSLIALEVMSRRNAKNILTAGGIAATISHVDFFSLPSQRLAFQIAANCAIYVTATEFPMVKDCLGDLTQRLSFIDDKRCVESICTFFNRLIENIRNHPDRLREIAGANFDFLKGVQQLLMIQPSTLGSNTFLSLLKSVRYMCTKCGDIAVALINMDFGRTLRYLLIGQEKGDDVSFDVSSRPSQQLKEIIELIGELMPNLPNTEVYEVTALLDHYMNIGGVFPSQHILRLQYPFDVLAVNWYVMNEANSEWRLLGAQETSLLENAKGNAEQIVVLELEGEIYEVDFIRMVRRSPNTGFESNLDRRLISVNNSSGNRMTDTSGQHSEADERNILKRSNSKTFLELIGLLCPLLVEIGTSSTCSSLRFETLKVMIRMIYAVESETQLRKVLNDVPLAIYISSTLSSNKNLGVLVSAIQLVHILLEKVPHLYVPLLDAEGVFHEIEKIVKSKALTRETKSTSSSSSRNSALMSAFGGRIGRVAISSHNYGTTSVATPNVISSSVTPASFTFVNPSSSSAARTISGASFSSTTSTASTNPSDLSLSSYLAAAAAVVSASAASSGNAMVPMSNAVNQYTHHFGQQLQQIQRQQQQLQMSNVAYSHHQLRSHAHASSTTAAPLLLPFPNSNMMVAGSSAAHLQQIFRQQHHANANALMSRHTAGHHSTTVHAQHHQHHQHIAEQQAHTNQGTMPVPFMLDMAGSGVFAGQQQHQFIAQQQQQQTPQSFRAPALPSSAVASSQQQQFHHQMAQAAAAAAAAQSLLNSTAATASSVAAPYFGSVISSGVGGTTGSLTASEMLIARAQAAFPGAIVGQQPLFPLPTSSAGVPSSSLSSQQLGVNLLQYSQSSDVPSAVSAASSFIVSAPSSIQNSQSALKQGILERLQKYIHDEASKILDKYTGDKATKYGIRASSNSVLNQLAKIAKQLSVQNRDVGCEPLNTFSGVLTDHEISAFQLNHSGITSALNVYLTDTSDKMCPPRKLRLRRFAAVFMRMTPDNMTPKIFGSDELVPFERLVNKVVLAIGQLEQFQVKITNLSGIVQTSGSGTPIGGSGAILNASALTSTTYLRGAQALRFFQTHQIRCNLKRHPACKQLREWRHGRGSIKVDPFTSISAIERYLLDRGIGLASAQMDDSSDNDEISDEEQDLSYSSATSYSGRIELYIGEHKIPSDTSILQAIRQFSLPHEEDSQETIPSSIWITAHTLYYKTADGAVLSNYEPNSGSTSPASSNQTTASSSVIRSVGGGSSTGAVAGSSNSSASPSPSVVLAPSSSSTSSRRYHHQGRSGNDRGASGNAAEMTGHSSSPIGGSVVSASRTSGSSRKTSRLSHRSVASGAAETSSTSAAVPKKEKYSVSVTKDNRVFKEGRVPKRSSPLQKFLSGSLDNPLDDSSVDCLVLLKTLYGLNTYWWALFDEEDDAMPPPSHSPILQAHVFHSPKLNSKVSRQLSDFLSVATQQIPKWTTDLVKAVPFAFPFVTRRNLLYCTSFGRDRALMHLVNEGTGDDHDGESTSRLIPRLERKKVSINRNNLLKDAQQVLTQIGSSKAMLEVGFEGEVGTGFGPTLEFYSTLSREIQKFSLKLWSGKSHKNVDVDTSDNAQNEYVLSENGLYPSIYRPSSSRQMDARIKKFEFFGRLLAQSLMDSRMLDIPIAATFFKWLINEEENFGLDDLETLEPTIYKSLQKISELDESDVLDLETYFTFPGENSFEMIKGGKNIQLAKSNLKQFVDLVCYWRLVEGVRPEMEAVRRGLQSVVALDSLRIFFANEIEQLFCGCPENGDEKIWSKTALQQALRPDHGFTYESIQIVWLIDMLNTFPNEKRRKFLQFVTGSPRLPVGGFRSLNPPLTVVRKTASYGNPENELPSAMTCYNYLKIPPYESYETFVERFEVALQFIYSFHLT